MNKHEFPPHIRKQLERKGYFDLTPEERVEVNRKWLKELAEIEVWGINEYKERNSGSDEFPALWNDDFSPPTEEDIAFLADKR